MTGSLFWDIIIVVGAIATIVGTAIAIVQMIARHRGNIPKIKIRLDIPGPIESPQPNDARLIKFNNIKLVLSNTSPYDAYEISFNTVLDRFLENSEFNKIEEVNNILARTDDLVFNFGLAGLIHSSERGRNPNEKFTLVLKSRGLDCGFMLSYENEKGRKYATQYKWNDGDPTLEFLKL